MSEQPVIGSNPSSAGGGAPSGAAGGELNGNYPNPTIKDGVIDDANIVSGGLTNAAISSSAAIAASKLAAIPESGVTNLTTDLAAKAPLASPTFTGTPAAPTAAQGTSTTQLATTAMVQSEVTLLAPKASPTFTGTPSLPTGTTGTTQSAGDSSTKLATTAFVTTADNLKADLASPTLTGTPAAPTAAQGTNTTQIATTAMVHSEAVLLAPLASPTFSGAPSLPTGTTAVTQAFGDSSTKPATTAFVQGLHQVVRRTSDSSSVTANTTLANDDTLALTIGASEIWEVRWYLIVNAANTTMDIKVAFTYPASCTAYWGALTPSGTLGGWGTGNAGSTPVAILTEATSSASYGTFAGTTGMLLDMIVINSTNAGTVHLQWAQNTSDAGALIMKANSMMIGRRAA